MTLVATALLVPVLALAAQVPVMPPRDQSGRPPGPVIEGTASIAGRIVDAETGLPLRRASVRAMLTTGPQPQGGQAHVTRTDDTGSYRLDKLPAGVYAVAVQRAGYVPLMPGLAAASDRPQRFTLEDGQRIANADFRLQRGGVIAGRVTDEAGEPAEAVTIRALRAQRTGGRETYVPAAARIVSSDDLGQFRLFGLAPGEYLLVADPQSGQMMMGTNAITQGDRTDTVPTYAPGTPAPSEAARITVVAGQTTAMDVQLVVARVVTVAGRVVDSSGARLEGGMVRLRSDGPDVSFMGAGMGMVRNGEFRITGVTPGAYTLEANATPMGPPGGSDAARLESARLPIVVGTEDVEGLVVTLQPPSSAIGRLVVEGDATKLQADTLRIMSRPVTPGAVMFGPPGGGRVEADLGLSLSGLRDELVLSVMGLPRGWWVKAVRLAGKDITDGFDFGAGRQWTGLEIVVNDRPASIGGQVLDPDGKPTTTALVLVFPVDYASRSGPRTPGAYGVGLPDQNAGFVVESLRPGEYFVVAVAAEQGGTPPFDDADRLAQLSQRAERVTLSEGDLHFMNVRVTP